MDETYELLELAHKGDKQAREALICNNLGLVYNVARRFENRGVEKEDLCQIGIVGLMKAIDKFDVGYEVKFSTYAVPLIMGEIKRFLRDDGILKVSRGIKEDAWRLKKAATALSQRNGRPPTISELCEETKLPKEAVLLALDSENEVESIYQQVYQADGTAIYLIDRLESGESEQEKVINRLLLEELLHLLTPEEGEIIRLRYYENKTQTEVAQLLGKNQVQISRMEKKILLRLRKECRK